MRAQFDLTIIGGGPVGLGLAAALRDSGLRIALIDPQALPPPAAGGWGSRCYALGPGTVALLREAGAWHRLPEERVARIETMRIFGNDPKSGLEFDAYEAGLSELAFIVENTRLQHALAEAAARTVHRLRPAHWIGIEVGREAAHVTLEDGSEITTQLVVAADGADSRVRTHAGIGVRTHDYRQLGVVANFGCERPHRGVAWQWFRPDGVLALLPLPGDRVSMVWSTGEAGARELLALDHEAFGFAVTEASRCVLGALTLITPPAAFPLKLQRVDRLIGQRLALIGDAAHTVHPLAGQGVNLGFRDVRVLAQVLRSRGAYADCGDERLLRRYERARREDVAVLQGLTDGLQKLFANQAVPLAAARDFGLGLLDGLPWLKSVLIHRAVA